MTARPPTRAKSTPSAARATNNFSNWEVISLGFGECCMGVLFDEPVQILHIGEPPGHGNGTPDHFVDGLLHGLNFHVHQGYPNAGGEDGQLASGL